MDDTQEKAGAQNATDLAYSDALLPRDGEGDMTLGAWRALTSCDGAEWHAAWLPLAPYLAKEGITLFTSDNPSTLVCFPPDEVERARREPGVYTLFTDQPAECDTQQPAPLIHPARDQTGRWVMLRAIRVGSEGTEHLEILRFLSSYPQRADSRNHCLPLLKELDLPRVTVGVFPFLSSEGIHYPWFSCLEEVLEFIVQVAESIAYFHEHLVAHRDMAEDNIIVNVLGLFASREEMMARAPTAWRSRFPIRYYIIDFELACRFDAHTPTEARLVRGLPIEGFARESAAEVYGEEPYDPFAADIFSVGLLFWRLFGKVTVPGFLDLIEQLLYICPSERPKACEVLHLFHKYREGLSATALFEEPVPQRVGVEYNEVHPHARLPTRACDKSGEGKHAEDQNAVEDDKLAEDDEVSEGVAALVI